MRLVRSVYLKVEGEESEDEAGGEEDPECEPGGGRGVVQLHAAQPHQPAQQPCSVALLLDKGYNMFAIIFREMVPTRLEHYPPVWKPSMKSPTYWTNMVMRPNKSPADMAMAALLHSGSTFSSTQIR